MRDRDITILHAVPTLPRHIAEQLGNGDRFDSVRLACLGGDRVRWSDVDRVGEASPVALLSTQV